MEIERISDLIRVADIPCIRWYTVDDDRTEDSLMIIRVIMTRTTNQISPKSGDRAAGSTKFTPSPLWAEPREPEPRFLHRTKLSSRPPSVIAAAVAAVAAVVVC